MSSPYSGNFRELTSDFLEIVFHVDFLSIGWLNTGLFVGCFKSYVVFAVVVVVSVTNFVAVDDLTDLWVVLSFDRWFLAFMGSFCWSCSVFRFDFFDDVESLHLSPMHVEEKNFEGLKKKLVLFTQIYNAKHLNNHLLLSPYLTTSQTG